MKVLVTGGCGYIGSHTIVDLLDNNYEVVCIDNFSNSKKDVLSKITQITGKNFIFYEGDVRDKNLLKKIFTENNIDCVIHFCGYKAVGESVKEPLKYYDNNLISTISLLEIMNEFNCKKIIFSSSATVYGNPKTVPIKEDFPTSTTNPYGTTKLFIENILKDLYDSDKEWSITILRYFNPIGAHKSGLIGENPNDIPNNLMPYITKVAIKELPNLYVFGDDYDTKDGTGVRDYIHVLDLARGHVLTINKIDNKGFDFINLGTGNGYSVLEIIKTFEKVNKVHIPYIITKRRAGDIDCCYASIDKAKEKLNFICQYNLEDMCRDAYNYARKNMTN